MNRHFKIVLFLTASLPTFAQPGSTPRLDSIAVVAAGAGLHRVSDQFTFTEGPAVDKSGAIYFTDQPNDKIWKYGTDGKLTLFLEKTGRSNGLFFDKKGVLVACADEKNQLWAISPKGDVAVLLTDFRGQRFNGPNDLWIHPNGGIFFTDPYYQREYWARKKPDLAKQNVYFLPKGQQQAVLVDSTLMQPNGIVGSPDGKFLYVADIRANKTYKYTISPDGSLSNRQLHVSQGSDGITLDAQGNLYLTGRGVTVYDPAGTKLGTIPVPSRWVGNVCFGGKDRRMLFITASESVYTLAMRVKGVE